MLVTDVSAAWDLVVVLSVKVTRPEGGEASTGCPRRTSLSRAGSISELGFVYSAQRSRLAHCFRKSPNYIWQGFPIQSPSKRNCVYTKSRRAHVRPGPLWWNAKPKQPRLIQLLDYESSATLGIHVTVRHDNAK
jgi:hypothetical protein